MSNLIIKKLGERIKKIRKTAGLSQSDLANKLSLSRQSVGQMEAGARYVNEVELLGIAKLFDLSVDSLLDFVRFRREDEWQNISGNDSINRLEKMSKAEFDYYEKL